jgi:hypothetical protein
MRYYNNEQFDINEDSIAKLPFSNKYFFITEINMTSPFNLNMDSLATPISEFEDDALIQVEFSQNLIEEAARIYEIEVNRILSYSTYNLDYATSNIIAQIIQQSPIGASPSPQVTTTMSQTTGMATTTGGSTGGSSGGGMSGGGY